MAPSGTRNTGSSRHAQLQRTEVVISYAAELHNGSRAARPPGSVVVLEFPSVDRATQWWDSADYAPAKSMRQMSASTEIILVPGV
jgi:uncharacterized protein (DUF1330 family)